MGSVRGVFGEAPRKVPRASKQMEFVPAAGSCAQPHSVWLYAHGQIRTEDECVPSELAFHSPGRQTAHNLSLEEHDQNEQWNCG
ncbi:hypothetical protein SAMN06265380_11765 [Ruegeria faecimaris]|uniref:Uncharacterized protein n=1 Tax=Ruegeria faecimaris TaxID=686389 RepID=A0A521F7J7_9RHOB|nr:hypothetical protein SAMN06265380_11765 [Ruegeria faecimaris]